MEDNKEIKIEDLADVSGGTSQETKELLAFISQHFPHVKLEDKEAMQRFFRAVGLSTVQGSRNSSNVYYDLEDHRLTHDEVMHDGEKHTAENYEAACDSPLYDAKKIVFTGKASVTKTDAGEYPMGLAEDQFSYNDTNFAKVIFKVDDGKLTITEDPGPGPGPGSGPGPGPIIKTWTIIYDLNGGTYIGSNQKIYESYPDGTVITIHAAPVREGYTFRNVIVCHRVRSFWLRHVRL